MRQAQAVGQELTGATVSIAMRAGEEGKLFGSVTNIHIEKALKAKGLDVDRRKIQLEQPIKTLGDFEVPVRLTADLSVPVKVSIIPEAALEGRRLTASCFSSLLDVARPARTSRFALTTCSSDDTPGCSLSND